MNIFLDTSILVKLYFPESDSDSLNSLFAGQQFEKIYIAEIAPVEFYSAVWKKVRTKELPEEDAVLLLQNFRTDIEKYAIIEQDNILVASACSLLTKYGKSGLRALDSLQLASAISVKDDIMLAKTSDLLLEKFLVEEELPVSFSN
jgi:predicted nucleic acid-binding protein